MKWTEREEEVLRKLYPNPDVSREDIVKVFPDRTWDGISQKAYRGLNLKRGRIGEVNEVYLKQLIIGKNIELE